MSDDDRRTLVREREVLNFPTLEVASDVVTEIEVAARVAAEVFTEVKVEYPVAIYVAPVVETAVEIPVQIPVETPVAVMEETSPGEDHDYVPEDIKQRLIYHWLTFGPVEWRADIVMAAPPPDPNPAPIFNPARFPRRRVIGHLDDGVARAIRPKEW